MKAICEKLSKRFLRACSVRGRKLLNGTKAQFCLSISALINVFAVNKQESIYCHGCVVTRKLFSFLIAFRKIFIGLRKLLNLIFHIQLKSRKVELRLECMWGAARREVFTRIKLINRSKQKMCYKVRESIKRSSNVSCWCRRERQ